jgi:hypothetical protein
MTKSSIAPPSPQPMSLIDAAVYHTLAASRLSPGASASHQRLRAEDLPRHDLADWSLDAVHEGQPRLHPRSTRRLRAKICDIITQALEEAVEEGYESDVAAWRESGATMANNARRFNRRDDDQRPTN